MLQKIALGLRHLAVICSCVLGFVTIVATGGGGGGGSPPVPPADAVGAWEGTLTSGTGYVYDVLGVVAPGGEMRMFDSGKKAISRLHDPLTENVM